VPPLLGRILLAWLGSAAALWVADWAFDGVQIDGWTPLLVAAAVLGVLSAVVKPVLMLLSIPLILLTLGLFVLVINIAVLAFTSWVVPGFTIAGFWTYIGTVIVTWLVTTAVSSLVGR
jgi:putative membrane protein